MLANVSQVLLLILAAIGYFYTVVPVYQRDILEEEIAKLRLERGEVGADVEIISDALQEKEAQLQEQELALRKMAYLQESLARNIAGKEKLLEQLDRKVKVLRSGLRLGERPAETIEQAKAALWDIYADNLSSLRSRVGYAIDEWNRRSWSGSVDGEAVEPLFSRHLLLHRDWTKLGDEIIPREIEALIPLKNIKKEFVLDGLDKRELEKEFDQISRAVLLRNWADLVCSLDLDGLAAEYEGDAKDVIREELSRRGVTTYAELNANQRRSFNTWKITGLHEVEKAYDDQVYDYMGCLDQASNRWRELLEAAHK